MIDMVVLRGWFRLVAGDQGGHVDGSSRPTAVIGSEGKQSFMDLWHSNSQFMLTRFEAQGLAARLARRVETNH